MLICVTSLTYSGALAFRRPEDYYVMLLFTFIAFLRFLRELTFLQFDLWALLMPWHNFF